MTIPLQKRGTNVLPYPYKSVENNHNTQRSGEVPAAASSSNTTTVQTLPIPDKFARQSMAMERLKVEFYDAFGRDMPRAIAQQVLRDIRAGVPAAYYSYAIEQTIYAPRPSWRYTMAIVARLQRTMASEDDMDYREGR